MTEKELRPIVEKWLQAQGYYAAREVRLGGYCDLIGCKWARRIGRQIPTMLEIMAIELKIENVGRVLVQAGSNCYYAEYSYAAMPLQKCESMRTATLQQFKDKGIGLLGVNACVNIFIPAHYHIIKHYPNICRNLWNFKIRHTKKKKD